MSFIPFTFCFLISPPDDVSVDREALLKLLQLVEDLGPQLVVLEPRVGHRVQDLQRLVEVVIAVMAVRNLELETQLELGVGHLLEAVLDLARLDQSHDLAVEGGRIRRVQVQDLVAYLQGESVS